MPELCLQRRVPDGPLARGQRLRRQLLRRASTPIAAAPTFSSTRCSCRSATTSTGPASSAPTSRRRATPASTWRSSAATRCSGRRGGRPASTARTRRIARWSRYKETHANAKIDPSPAWTGTWRDPRFSPPSDGGRPENALTGTIFDGQRRAPRPITVPAAMGRQRFWRNTASPPSRPADARRCRPGRSGYEWDEDLDNGARPAGLHASLVDDRQRAGAELQDYGSTVRHRHRHAPA